MMDTIESSIGQLLIEEMSEHDQECADLRARIDALQNSNEAMRASLASAEAQRDEAIKAIAADPITTSDPAGP